MKSSDIRCIGCTFLAWIRSSIKILRMVRPRALTCSASVGPGSRSRSVRIMFLPASLIRVDQRRWFIVAAQNADQDMNDKAKDVVHLTPISSFAGS